MLLDQLRFANATIFKALAMWVAPAPPPLNQDSLRDSMRWLAIPFDKMRPLRDLKSQIDEKSNGSRKHEEDEGEKASKPRTE